MSLLVIDSGNTRIKWGLNGPQGWMVRGAHADPEELAFAWKDLPARSAIGSNVAGRNMQTLLEGLRPDLKFVWIESKPSQCGVSNGYSVPNQLGADRWAALIGARRLLPRGGLVVDLGTAATVDVLSPDGKFMGGIIVPGLKAMHDSIRQNTGLDPEQGRFSFPPTSTADAVHCGAVLALAGAIDKSARSSGYRECLLGGGDAESVIAHLDVGAKIVDNLVLDGLVLIAGDCA